MFYLLDKNILRCRVMKDLGIGILCRKIHNTTFTLIVVFVQYYKLNKAVIICLKCCELPCYLASILQLSHLY